MQPKLEQMTFFFFFAFGILYSYLISLSVNLYCLVDVCDVQQTENNDLLVAAGNTY